MTKLGHFFLVLLLNKVENNVVGFLYFTLIFFSLPENQFSQSKLQNLKWDCSAVIYFENNIVFAEDRYGNIIKKEAAGKDDAGVIQSAINSVGKSGEIKICKGKYFLNKSVNIFNNVKVVGEGRGTTIVPPFDDYAFIFEESNVDHIPRPNHTKEGHPLYAIIFRDIAIDGQREGLTNSGKGIYLKRFWSTSFENLWIQNTSTAIYVRNLHESDFSNIYLINNGNASKKEASVFITNADNLHFSGLYVIYPNYIGLEIVNNAKIIFITQSMFHGWLKREGKSEHNLIEIRDLNNNKEGRMKSDIVIENSRITVGGEGSSVVNIVNSPVTMRQCVATPGFGSNMISATENSRINISDNSFYSLKPLPVGANVLYAENSEVIFKNNVISNLNMQVRLKAVRNSIFADNRFDVKSGMPNIYISETEIHGSRNIQVKGNIFRKDSIEEAVKVSSKSTKNIFINNNQLWSE